MFYAKRFFAKIYKNGPNGCWLWTGARHRQGYGNVNRNGKSLLAHREMLRLTRPDEYESNAVVMHLCDNTQCVNPSHLKGASQRDNIMDAIGKGLKKPATPVGEAHGCAKLTKENVLEMRRLRGEGMFYKDIAKKFNVATMTAHRAINGKAWNHV